MTSSYLFRMENPIPDNYMTNIKTHLFLGIFYPEYLKLNQMRGKYSVKNISGISISIAVN